MPPRPRFILPRRRPLRTTVLVVTAALTAAACSKQSDEERARDVMEKIEKGMVDVEGIALEQKLDAAVVSETQRNLTTINEYQGEITGKLDSVTINAIQAFQRTAGLNDDGIITEATRQKLAAAAARGQS